MNALLPLPPQNEAQLAGWPLSTPKEAIQDLILDEVHIHERQFLMSRPADPDLLLEHPETLKAFEHDEYMPYWCDLWPAARMLAKVLLQKTWPPGIRTLDLGCGTGMSGVAGLAAGLDIHFSDYDAMALRFAGHNALQNGFNQFTLLPIDWRKPPEITFPFILGADLVYEERSITPIIGLLKKMLAKDGECWITDQDRKPGAAFCKELEAQGFRFEKSALHAGQPSAPGQIGRRVKGSLYVIRWK